MDLKTPGFDLSVKQTGPPGKRGDKWADREKKDIEPGSSRGRILD
jgi:hypothetical protein